MSRKPVFTLGASVFLFIISSLFSSAAAAPGATPGDGSVSATGAATYNIPIRIPAGINGMQPNLALSYHSRNGRGEGGWGWAISGVSAIERCGQIFDIHGKVTGVELGTNDRFCLDGVYLNNYSGTYGANNTSYHLERFDYSVLYSYRGTGDGTDPSTGPQWFQMKSPDGLLYEFGRTVGSRLEPVGSDVPVRWALNKVTDPNGNYIEFTYSELTTYGVHYLDKVDYTGTGFSAPIYQVDFDYQDRPATDYRWTYVGGAKQRDYKRLSNIIVRHNASEIKRYTVSYELSGTSPTAHSLLSSVQECVAGDCLPATEFTWQAPTETGFHSTNTSAPVVTYDIRVMDMDGDGRKDIGYLKNGAWHYRLSTSGLGDAASFGDEVNTGSAVTLAEYARTLEFNGDGRSDLIFPENGLWQVLRNNGGTFTKINTNISSYLGGATPTNMWPMDVNGDGLDDLVYAKQTINAHTMPDPCISNEPCNYIYTGFVEVFFRLNTGSAFGAEQLGKTISSKSLPYEPFPRTGFNFTGRSSVLDFDADGKDDLLILVRPVTNPSCTNCNPELWRWVPLRSTGTGFQTVTGLATIPPTVTPLPLDVNGDGMTDLAYVDPAKSNWMLSIANGGGFNVPVETAMAKTAEPENAFVMDYNGDGLDDVLLPTNASGSWLHDVSYSSGSTLTTRENLSLSASNRTYVWIADFNGDGSRDMLRVTGTPKTWVLRLNKTGMNDRLEEATDGLGNYVRYAYSTTSHDAHNATSPGSGNYWLTNAVNVVSRLTRSDGNTGSYHHDYTYSGGARHAGGRGFLGFGVVRATDSRDGRFHISQYLHSSPYFGIKNAENTRVANGAYISWSSTTWGSAVSTNNGLDRYHIRPTRQVTDTYVNPGQRKSAETVDFLDYDTWGNPQTLKISNRNAQSSNLRITTISNVFSNGTAGTRCIGMLESSSATLTYPLVANPPATRSTNTWDTSKCRVTTASRDVPNVSGTTSGVTYGYDTFGNVVSETLNGSNVPSRQSAYAYEPLGYRLESVTNAVGHTATRSWDPTLRYAVSEQDPNGLSTHYSYDDFGRVTRVDRADGTYLERTLEDCTGCSLSRLLLTEELFALGESVSGGRRISHIDRLGRIRQTSTPLLDGSTSYVKTTYDALGRVTAQTVPYTSTSTAHATTYGYDIMDRLIAIVQPGENGIGTRVSNIAFEPVEPFGGCDSGGGDGSGRPPQAGCGGNAYYSDQAYRISVQDPEGRVTQYHYDEADRLRSVVDAGGSWLRYEYDWRDQLTKTIDPAGNEIVIGYNTLGQRTSMNDPNLGLWQFQHDVLGQLVSQTDARNQATTFEYDLAGRPTKRTSSDGISTWTYDTAPGAGIGKAHQATGPDGYLERYVYDALGRPLQQMLDFDASSYQYDFQYDTFSRLSRLVYPVSVATAEGDRFAVDYQYSAFGHLSQVLNTNNPAEVFWQATDMDASGRYTTSILGNDITSVKEFDAATGRLKTQRSFAQGQPELWNLHYEYSPSGNVTARENTIVSQRETFSYDNLDRLTGYSLNGAPRQTVAYNALGNLTSKTGVGTYAYGGTRPHAVTSTSGAVTATYHYDANGNMTQRGATAFTWSADNKPLTINQGTDQLTFKYGPGGNRYKQFAQIAGQGITTHYIGGLMEAVGGNGVVQYRHSIVAGGDVIAQHTRDSDTVGGNPRTTYTERDLLGSIGLVTDGTAAVIGQMHFDPWGKRIDATDWDGDESQAAISALRDITHRGFTDHEMLDAMNLVHMNGRVYDPGLARMLGADPINSNPANLQRYNRYSYALNNPLGYVDPSGYDPCTNDSDCTILPTEVVGENAQRIYNPSASILASSITSGLSSGSSAGGAGGGSGIAPPPASTNEEDAAQLEPVVIDGPSEEDRHNLLGQRIARESLLNFVRSYMTAWARASALVQAGFYKSILLVMRVVATDESTTSTYELIGGDAEGYMLEPPGPDSDAEGSGQRIQEGEYELTSRVRPNGSNALSVNNVPGRTNILIHIGNNAMHTRGCLLPGSTYGVNQVGSSTSAFNQLHGQISSGGRSRIVVTGGG